MKYHIHACLLLAATATGCGGDSGAVNTHPVSGVVTYKNEPVVGATVSFIPQSEGQPAAFGRTDEQGRYELTTYQPGDGAAVGNYQVTVTKYEATQTDVGSGTTEEDPNYQPPPDNPRPAPPPKSLLPAKYAAAATTDLIVEVREGRNTFDLALSD